MSDISRMEALLQALIDGKTTDIVPNSRAEACLLNCIEGKGDEGLPEPNSNLEAYLTALAVKLKEGGGGSGDSWYDTFWDNYQQNGERIYYSAAFSNVVWNDVIFKPKYDIKATGASDLFYKSSITDLVGILNDAGVILDVSKSTNLNQLFYKCVNLTRVPEILPNNASYHNAFGDCNSLVSIAKLRIGETAPRGLMFANCNSLEHVIFEGIIAFTLDLKWSPLTAESAKSAISILKNYAGTENEFTNDILFSETTWSYLDAEGDTASPNGNSWREYILSLGWNY